MWEGIPNKIQNGLYYYMQSIAEDSAERIKRNISISYPPASVPGMPPHKRSGELESSITSKVIKGSNKVEAHISANADYAVHLEYGTSKMAPRPFMRTELYRLNRTIWKRIAQGIETILIN